MNNRQHVLETLESKGIETRLVDRFGYCQEVIDWADVIFTTGGDGTFLMAASKITNRNKPVIGINSDPTRSVGHLCIPTSYTTDFANALEKLLQNQFRWKYRQRIRITLSGVNAMDDPIELHDQQLKHPEFRFLDLEPRTAFDNTGGRGSSSLHRESRVLPIRALNEVFIGESLSSRVSYYELGTNGTTPVKLKSSGVTICTGTGSTSWSFNINKLTHQVTII